MTEFVTACNVSGRNRKVSCEAFFYTEMSSVRVLEKKMKWVRFKYFLNAKLHSSDRLDWKDSFIFIENYQKITLKLFMKWEILDLLITLKEILLMLLGSATVYISRCDGHCCSWMSQVLEPEKGCRFSLAVISYLKTPSKKYCYLLK